MSCNRLKMNAEKTQVICTVLDRDSSWPKSTLWSSSCCLPTFNFQPRCNIGVHFESQLTKQDHVTATCRSCFFQLRQHAGHQKLINDRCSQDVGTGVPGRSAWLLQQSHYMVSAKISCDVCKVSRMGRQDSSRWWCKKIRLYHSSVAWSSLVTSATKDNLQDRHFDVRTSRVKIVGGGGGGFDPPGAVVDPLWKSAKMGLGVGFGQFTAK